MRINLIVFDKGYYHIFWRGSIVALRLDAVM
jgi:hypothetical protein